MPSSSRYCFRRSWRRGRRPAVSAAGAARSRRAPASRPRRSGATPVGSRRAARRARSRAASGGRFSSVVRSARCAREAVCRSRRCSSTGLDDDVAAARPRPNGPFESTARVSASPAKRSSRSSSSSAISQPVGLEQLQPELAARREARHGVPERSSGTSPTTAIVAACSVSAISTPVNVAPTTTPRTSSTTSRDVPGAPRPTKLAARVRRRSRRRRAHLHPCSLRPSRKRPADGGDLRVGEDHARRERPVRDERSRLRPRIDVGREPALVLAHVREQRATVRVADRIEPVVPGRAEVSSRPRPACPARARSISSPRLSVSRLPADGDEQLVAARRWSRPPASTVTSPSRATETARRP